MDNFPERLKDRRNQEIRRTEHVAHLQTTLEVTPGASQTRSKAPGHVGPADVASGYPLFARGGRGAYLEVGTFAVSQTLLDCFGANAAIPLGYAHPKVQAAVQAALAEGPLLSLPHFTEYAVSKNFLALCAPWADQVRWVKTGSEAVSAAIRLARIATGRDKIVMFDHSYHGWHDPVYARHQVKHPSVADPVQAFQANLKAYVYANGVPTCLGDTVQVMPYGSDDWSFFSGSRTAALLVEAHRFQKTDRDWLQACVNKARQAGAVVIFDEMVYGLRWAKGGAAEYYGIEPDLACFGKALGNGVPVACVCGATALMEAAAAYVSGTYGGDTLGLAAAQAVLHEYRERDVISELWDKGDALWAAFRRFAPADFMLHGFPVHWRLVPPALSDVEILDRALLIAAQHGVLVHRSSNNASAAMTAEEAYHCGKVLGNACTEALQTYMEAMNR